MFGCSKINLAHSTKPPPTPPQLRKTLTERWLGGPPSSAFAPLIHMPRLATTLLVALAALGARGWQWRMVSSAPFDRSVANFSSCGASPPPAAERTADRTYPVLPPPLSPKPPAPPPPAASSGGDLVVDSQSIATDDAELVPSLRGGRRGADGCHATFTWIEEQRWTDGLRARLAMAHGVIRAL